MPAIRKILVVCPASLKTNWYREMRTWLVRDYCIAIGSSQVLPLPVDGFDICIINYDILRKHLDKLQAVEWDLLVADEVHYCKSESAQRSKALYSIPAKRKVGLTGTPIVNKPAELWPIISWLDPETWHRKKTFYLKRYCNANFNGYGYQTGGAAIDRLPELQETLRRTIMIRRLKNDVLKELPPKMRQVIEVEASGESARVVQAEWELFGNAQSALDPFRAAVELAKTEDDEEAYRSAVAALKEAQGVQFTNMAKARKEAAMAKVPFVVDHIRSAVESSGKVVVFAHHHCVVDALREAFPRESVALTGQTKMQDRAAAVDRFQSDGSCTVFIGSIMAAGVGLTLTAASHVVFAELDWVPGNVSQAEDRCHRIGQRDTVLVQHLALEGSVDAAMANTIVRKQKAIDAALDKDAPKEEPGVEEVEVVEPKEKPASRSSTRDQIAKMAESMTPERIAAVHSALQVLDSYCDGASSVDAMGFSKVDVQIGKDLSRRAYLTPKQAALGYKIAWKYRRQLSADLLESIAA